MFAVDSAVLEIKILLPVKFRLQFLILYRPLIKRPLLHHFIFNNEHMHLCRLRFRAVVAVGKIWRVVTLIYLFTECIDQSEPSIPGSRGIIEVNNHGLTASQFLYK